MTVLRVAAVQASYVLMDRDATIDRVAALTASAAREGAQLVVFPEVFVPGTPLWIDTQAIWDGDEERFGLLARNAVVIGDPASDRLAAIAAEHGVWLVVGVDEREAHGATIYNTVLYFAPDGELAGRHRKLMPTGAERTVWGMGDGSTLAVVDAGRARIGGLICWENYMPLARFHLYAQGVDVWLAPTLAQGDGWIGRLPGARPPARPRLPRAERSLAASRQHRPRGAGRLGAGGPGPRARGNPDRRPRPADRRDSSPPHGSGWSLPPAGHLPAVRRHLTAPRGDRTQSLRSP